MSPFSALSGPIGVFDSGYGGLTILSKFRELLPKYDYIYLGDNARTPYGTRSFEVVYEFTLQAVRRLFDLGCPLVILACNTASAKALRSIQQNDLPHGSYPADSRIPRRTDENTSCRHSGNSRYHQIRIVPAGNP